MAKKYIDADRLKAEIERRNLTNYCGTAEQYEEELFAIIGSLQQERTLTDCNELQEPEVDLEEAAWDCVLDSIDVNNPVLLPKYKELLLHLFKAGAGWQKQQMLQLAKNRYEVVMAFGTGNPDVDHALQMDRLALVKIIEEGEE